MDKQTYINRKRAEYGDRFSATSLADRFWPFVGERNTRITVERTYPSGEVYRRSGSVGVTTGWVPSFMLLSRVTSTGSSDLLDDRDRIVEVYQRRIRNV
jgi:hypothetical protein